MKVDRRSFFAGAAALGATAHVADLVDVSRDAPSFLPGGEGKAIIPWMQRMGVCHFVTMDEGELA